MTDEDTGLRAWFNGVDVKLIVSGDGGASWGGKMTVFGVEAQWPGMVTLDEGSFLVMANYLGAKSQRVSLV